MSQPGGGQIGCYLFPRLFLHHVVAEGKVFVLWCSRTPTLGHRSSPSPDLHLYSHCFVIDRLLQKRGHTGSISTDAHKAQATSNSCPRMDWVSPTALMGLCFPLGQVPRKGPQDSWPSSLLQDGELGPALPGPLGLLHGQGHTAGSVHHNPSLVASTPLTPAPGKQLPSHTGPRQKGRMRAPQTQFPQLLPNEMS